MRTWLHAVPTSCHVLTPTSHRDGSTIGAAGQQQSVQGPADSSTAAPCCLGPWGCCLADGTTGSKGKMLQVGVGAGHQAGQVLVGGRLAADSANGSHYPARCHTESQLQP
ncbi:hypothetical protein V8C86DRAFT_2438316 [Haematococcus lacustris]